MNTITKNSRIAIVGGGIGGLALAIALLQRGYNRLKVFEKDRSFQTRRQGYGLTILQGKRALRELGILQQAKTINAPTRAHYFFDQKGSILGFYGTLFWDTEKGHRSKRWRQKGLSMHIPRQQLRRLLLTRLQELTLGQEIMTWNSRLQNIAATQHSVALKFEDGQKFQADLVVGCDGIHSSVRKLSVVNDRQLNFLGIMIVLGICGSQHTLSEQRIFQSSNGEGRFYSMPFMKELPQYSSMWQFSVPMPLAEINQYKGNPQMLQSWLLSYCDGWHSPIPELIRNTQLTNIMTLQAFDRDPEIVQTFDERIMLQGDASHPMSPFKSQGANQALLDAINLTALIAQHQNISAISSAFRKEQFERTSKKVLASRQRVNKYHTPTYLSSQAYIYPKIDANLISLLNQAHINWNDNKIEDTIISIMKKHHYII